MAGRVRPVGKRLILLGLTTGATLLAAEAVLRLPAVANRALPYAHFWRAQRQWPRERYDARSFVSYRGRAFRSDHLTTPVDPTRTTVLVLGDSFTWGDKVADTDSIWPFVMERDLMAADPRIRVVNLAQRSFTTVNELEMLETMGWDFHPDVVVLQYLLNDPVPSAPGFYYEPTEWIFTRRTPLARWERLHIPLNARSYLYSLLNARFESWQAARADHPGMDYNSAHTDRNPWWGRTREAFADLAATCRERDIPVGVVVWPVFEARPGLGEDYPYALAHARIMDALAAAGLPALDLRPVFAAEGRTGQSWWAVPGDGHPGAEAHALAGRETARFVERLIAADPR